MIGAARRVLVPMAVQPRPPALGDVVHLLTGATMGTTWQVRLGAAPRVDLDTIAAGIQARLDEVVAQMSTWWPDSDLCRYNRAAPGTWATLPAPFCEVLATALAVARASGGAFDPTVGPLVDAWGFGPAGGHGVPPAEAVSASRARCDWHRIDFDPAARRLRQVGGVALDFSAIAKGYGVDRVADWLDRRGLTAHLVEVGGELKGSGVKPDGRPWMVALEHPEAERTSDLWVALNGVAVATSGDYRRSFEQAGQRYAHTLDTRTGAPVRHGLASVSVLHPACMAADAWSTALTVLGEAEGLACAERHGIAARFVSRAHDGTWRERLSAACAAWLA